MISAFGVEHGISKAMPDKVPDWASGAMPASTARAYNYSEKKKTQAASNNLAWRSTGSAAGALTGATLVGLAFRKAKPMRGMPKFFYKDSKVPNPFTGKKVKITPGEKQRYLAGATLGGALGTVGGATAGAVHLDRLKKDPKYNFDEGDKK